MLFDLDRFKDVNDVMGHRVGDQLLKVVSERMEDLLRKSDTIARMGGDEFLLLLPEISQIEDAAKIARKIINSFKSSFTIDHQKIHITTSIGIVICPEDGENSDTLIKNADIAMYQVKEKGRNNYQFHKKLI
jgi:diguanylate cyclase (GGDEF)-like protein